MKNLFQMSLKELILIKLILTIFINFGICQTSSDNLFKVPEVVPKSAEASSLGNYGKYTVSEYSGLPDISIPLITIKEGALELPISLKYNASGIKVAQEATWVGLGWDLIAGGVISYIPVGEDERLHFAGLPYSTLDYEVWENLISYVGATAGFAGKSFSYNDILYNDLLDPYLSAEASSFENGEIDMYSANFMGYSFRFLFHPRTLEPIFVGEKNGCQIELDSDVFKIVGEDGVKYYFEAMEYASDFQIMGGSIWYLTKIEDTNGNWITFTYNNFGDTYTIPTLNEQVIEERVINDTQFNSYNEDRIVWYFNNTVKSLYLTEINSSSVNIRMVLGMERNDINGSGARRLEEIIIKDKVLNTTRYHYKFEYGYFEACSIGGNYIVDRNRNEDSDNHPATVDNLTKRLKLESLKQINPQNSQEISQQYDFEYYEDYKLPYKTSFSQDFWGYFNGQENSSGLIPDASHTMIPDANVIKDFENDFSTIPVNIKYHTKGTANRGMSKIYARTATLKSIKYPTGGKTIFDFEPHEIDNRKYLSAEDFIKYRQEPNNFDINTATFIGGGLRVASITNYDMNNDIISKKKYSYLGGSHIAPLSVYVLERYLTADVVGGSGNCPSISASKNLYVHKLSCNNYYPLANSLLGTNVGYSKVVIEELSDTIPNGQEILTFWNSSSNTDYEGRWFMQDYLNGKLKTREIKSSADKAVRLENYTYDNNDIDRSFRQVMYKDIYHGPELTFCGDISLSSQTRNFDRYRAFVYENFSFFCELESKSVTETFQDGTTFSTNNIYTYNDEHHFLESIEMNNSQGDQITTHFLYPQDYPNETSGWIGQMKDANIVDKVIETYTLKSGSESTVTSGALTTYKMYSDVGLPEKVYQLNTTNGLKLNNEFYPSNNSGSFVRDDDHYDEVITYDLHTNGNLEQYHEANDIDISYIWGYNDTYPIAKAANAMNVEICFDSFEESNEVEQNRTDSEKRTGHYSYVLNSNDSWINFCSLNDRGIRFSDYFKFSVWYKTADYADYTNVANFGCYVYDENGTELGTSTSIGLTETGGDWKMATYNLNLKKYKDDFPNATTFKIVVVAFKQNNYTVYLDDFRAHPSDTPMTTYTYDPLVGMTSSTDERNRTTHYIYDDFGRLKEVKDHEGNLLQRHDYNYAH